MAGENAFTLDDDPDVQNAAQSLIDNMSPPSDDATITHAAEDVGQTGEGVVNDTAASSDDLDDAGEAFNPAIHAASRTKTKQGHWKRRRGQGANRSTVRLPQQRNTTTVDNTAAIEAAGEAAKLNAKLAGAAAANSVFLLGTVIGGEEWRPITVDKSGISFEDYDEKKAMSEAFENYMLAKGITDFPPGLTLGMVLLQYASVRFAMPKTQAKVGRFKQWLVLRVAKRKIKKALKKQGIDAEVTIQNGDIYINGRPHKHGAHISTRNDSQREDDPRTKPL